MEHTLQKNKCAGEMFLGYLTSSLDKSITDWNDFLGSNVNKHHCVGIWVNSRYTHCFLYDQMNFNKQLPLKAVNGFKNNDIFIMKFDFSNRAFTLYYNDEVVDTLDFDHESITIAFTLMAGNFNEINEIQITEWKFS